MNTLLVIIAMVLAIGTLGTLTVHFLINHTHVLDNICEEIVNRQIRKEIK